MAPDRVAFYGLHEHYRNILGLVRDRLDPDVESLLSGDKAEVVRFEPHVLVLAAHENLEYFRQHLPGASIGNIRHGMVSKAVLQRTPRRAGARTYDFLCCGPDDTAVEIYRRASVVPREIWRTGYPQLDPLHRRDPAPDLGLDSSRPTVLYAPTWNLGLSSAPLLGGRVVDLIRAGAPAANIIIKPHPVVREWRPGWMRTWARLAREERHVRLIEDTHADVTPYMLASDLMVSDASSVIFEFLALDRPMVLVTNPRHRADVAYDPQDIIWRWRDIGSEVHRAADLPAAVAAELAAPARRADQRARYARILFEGQTDGQNARRVAALVSRRSHEIAARGPAGRASGRLLPGRWFLGDLARSIWQRPWPRAVLIAPLERLRLARRELALQTGRLRAADGSLIEPLARVSEAGG